jgi:hypothetical protein
VSDLLCLNMLRCTRSRERATLRTIQMSRVWEQRSAGREGAYRVRARLTTSVSHVPHGGSYGGHPLAGRVTLQCRYPQARKPWVASRPFADLRNVWP